MLLLTELYVCNCEGLCLLGFDTVLQGWYNRSILKAFISFRMLSYTKPATRHIPEDLIPQQKFYENLMYRVCCRISCFVSRNSIINFVTVTEKCCVSLSP